MQAEIISKKVVGKTTKYLVITISQKRDDDGFFLPQEFFMENKPELTASITKPGLYELEIGLASWGDKAAIVGAKLIRPWNEPGKSPLSAALKSA